MIPKIEYSPNTKILNKFNPQDLLESYNFTIMGAEYIEPETKAQFSEKIIVFTLTEFVAKFMTTL
jgi:hypothetical protein